MPYKDPARQKEAVRSWRVANAEVVRAYRNRYYRKNSRRIAVRRLLSKAATEGKSLTADEAWKQIASQETIRRFLALVLYELADGPRPIGTRGRPRKYPGARKERHKLAQVAYRKRYAESSGEVAG